MIPKIMLSITSFIPLYILMIIKYIYFYIDDCQSKEIRDFIFNTTILVVVLCIISMLVVSIYIKNKESLNYNENEIIFKNIKEDKKASMNYMMTYLLPLMMFNGSSINEFDIVYMNMFILVFVFINAKSENFNMNVVLWMKGYSVYIGLDNYEEEKVLLIKKKKFSNINSNQVKYKFVSFGGSKDIYLCKRYIE